MPTLDSSLRDQLATVIGKDNADGGARAVAEAGARAALSALAVHLAAPYAHLDATGRQLRNRLRARARQLGDIRRGDGQHEIDRLVEQAAYEHWHRMLFARFLAENELLIHPEMKVAVTLDECAELAASEGAVDGWELAGRYASRMLPQIFRPDDPLLAVRYAIDDVKKLEALLDGLPAELFCASDSLGWCYQFWQARKKKQVHASEVKIGADELPAVTQLFTEPYMVQFLLHNTLGAWWVGAGRALPAEMPYLRRLEDGTPAAGTFEGWPRLARELKVLDPCCGSGHFLVEAFLILVGFRMAEEGLSPGEACDAVLRDNLFGLEIDARCVQIAAFALALAAWTFPGAGGYRPLAGMSVACSGLAISAKKEEWERLGGEDLRLRNGMGRMWELFKDAPVLGSLIDPLRDPPDPLYTSGPNEVLPVLGKALSTEAVGTPDDQEVRVAARGIADAATVLTQLFSLVCTNVPFLLRRKQDEALASHLRDCSAESANDLATGFLYRVLRQCSSQSTVAIVIPQDWLYKTSYRKFRTQLLSNVQFELLASLGPNSFRDMNWWATKILLLVISDRSATEAHLFSTVSLGEHRITDEKAALLRATRVARLSQRGQLKNPDARIVFERLTDGVLLSKHVRPHHGLTTGDLPRMQLGFWELPRVQDPWIPFQSTVPATSPYAGRHYVLRWNGGAGAMRELPGARRDGLHAWGRAGVLVSQMGSLPVSLYGGGAFDVNTSALIPHDESDLSALWAFCSSPHYAQAVRRVDQALKVTTATLAKIPFDVEHWRNQVVALPSPSTSRLDEIIFQGNVARADSPLQVAVARLLNYRWPDQAPDPHHPHAHPDGIVCIPALRGERPAADRLADLLAAAWGKDWHPQTLTDLLAAVGHTGSLEEWLRNTFFKQHCELFHHRPFVWHVWDGHREGFSALVNYHKLDHETLKALTWSYLGDWIRTQEIERPRPARAAPATGSPVPRCSSNAWPQSSKVRLRSTCSCAGSPSNSSPSAGTPTWTTACA